MPVPYQERRRAGGKAERMSDVEIKVRANGPYVIRGTFVLRDAAGNPIEQLRKNDTVALCRCGATGAPPFCDGSHARDGDADRAATPA